MLRKMKVLVTGASGFVGSHVATALREAGHEVLTPEADIRAIDIGASAPFDALVHQAAITDTLVRDRALMMEVNLDASKKLFEDALRAGARHIVYASSTAVYGNLSGPLREDMVPAPLNIYGESKALLDAYARDFAALHPEMTLVGLRYCNVYGPGEMHKGAMASMIYKLARAMREGNPKIFKWGEQRREYIYIDDVVQANMLVLAARESGVYNCATGRPVSFNDVITTINAALGTSHVPQYIDNPSPQTYQSHIECDVSLAKEKLGFVAEYDLQKGIDAYLRSGFLD
jgi:ADP-L-glycero-D-manno-heptose 6-epimerase